MDSMQLKHTANTRDLIFLIKLICMTLLPCSNASDTESFLRPALTSPDSIEMLALDELLLTESMDETVALSNLISADCKRLWHKKSRKPYRKTIAISANVSINKRVYWAMPKSLSICLLLTESGST
jgi:hypothetical protein